MVEEGNVRVKYSAYQTKDGKDWEQFVSKVEAHKLFNNLISTDEKAGVPRTSFEGIIETRPFGKHMLFFTPQAALLNETFDEGKSLNMGIAAFSDSLRVVLPKRSVGCLGFYHYCHDGKKGKQCHKKLIQEPTSITGYRC